MSVAFYPPGERSGGQDLSIAISPLGLVELADEEFEVHGPRLNRYSLNWAHYLGYHWGYKREAGEAQLTFNWCKAFCDYLIDFQFSKGIQFRVPEALEAIAVPLYRRVWEQDNDKDTLLWEIGQLGSVSGDVFIKVAYEEAYVDSIGRLHPGRCRIIPLNPAFCFPEYHPHDRSRLLRFKLKYRFWGTSLEGTRSVYTYVELITDDVIEEYVNDELISQRVNPLGTIPIVPIQNTMISSSPWGLSDMNDIIALNREYNIRATAVSDTLSYHAEPVTIITGAKASNLEKGSKKVWGGLPPEAKVFNLEGVGNLAEALAYLELLKKTMHELTGIPQGALGETQPISNTSGVALYLTYLPLMQRYNRKKAQYSKGFMRVNELIMITMAQKEPGMLVYNPGLGVPLEADNYKQLDPNDPLIYQCEVHWPPPLPLDIQMKLLEIQTMMEMGLQSKSGALRELGYESPQQVLADIFDELIEDVKDQGTLDIMRGQIMHVIGVLTGDIPTEPEASPGETGPGVPSTTSTAPTTALAQTVLAAQEAPLRTLLAELVQRAEGRSPSRSEPQNNS